MNLQLVIIVVGLLTTIATSLWGIHLNNGRSDKLEAKMDARFAQLDAKIDGKVDSLRSEVNSRFDNFQQQVNSRFDNFQQQVNSRFDGLQRDFNQFYLLTGKLDGRIESIEKRPS